MRGRTKVSAAVANRQATWTAEAEEGSNLEPATAHPVAEVIALATEVHHRAQETPRAMRLVVLRGEVRAVRQRLAVRAAVRAWVDPVVAAGLAAAAAGGGGR